MSFPPYPADSDGQVEWYTHFKNTLNMYIMYIQAAYNSYKARPLNLNQVYRDMVDLVNELDQWVATAVHLVSSSENRSTPESIKWLREMALVMYPRTRAMKDLYLEIERLYLAALPPMPDVDLTPAKGREGFYM